MMSRSVWACFTISFSLLSCLLFSCLILARSAKAADYNGVYEGTIGAARVVVELADSSGFYFYANKGVDIFLQVSERNGTIEVIEKSSDDDESAAPTGRWTLSAKAGALTGTWSPPKTGRTLPLALKRVADLLPREQRPDDINASVAYKQRWLAARLHWSLGAETLAGDLSYAVATDSIYGTRMPRLVRFPDERRKAAINQILEKAQIDKIFEMRENAISLRQTRAARDKKSTNAVAETSPDSEEAPHVTKLTPDALSFVIRGIWDGGGAHPNTYVAAYTVDIARSKLVEGTFLSSFDAKSGKIFDGALNLDRPEKRKAFDTLWVAKLRASLPKTVAKSEDNSDADCIEAIEAPSFLKEGGASYYLYLAEGGLAVHPNGWPNVAAYCFSEFKYVPVILTTQDLQPFLTPGQHLIGAK
jgi:hypothetical protein